jgi:hypothetical protein
MHTRYGFDDGGTDARRRLLRWAFAWTAAIAALIAGLGL